MNKKILLLLLIIPVIFILSLYTTTPNFKKWTYNLPNHYVVGKVGEDDVIIGKYIDNKLTAKTDDKTIGISEYVEAFSYSDKYIYARTLTNEKKLTVNYYIIDSLEEKIYGSYDLEGFNNKLEELNLTTEVNWNQSANYDK